MTSFNSFNTVPLPAIGGFTPQPWIEYGAGVNNIGQQLAAVDALTGSPVNSFQTTPGVQDSLTNYNSVWNRYGQGFGLSVGQSSFNPTSINNNPWVAPADRPGGTNDLILRQGINSNDWLNVTGLSSPVGQATGLINGILNNGGGALTGVSLSGINDALFQTEFGSRANANLVTLF